MVVLSTLMVVQWCMAEELDSSDGQVEVTHDEVELRSVEMQCMHGCVDFVWEQRVFWTVYDIILPSDLEVPEQLENNKGNICVACTSPPIVLRAYHAQFQKDFSMFLRCRAEELVVGGRMVLTFLGRRSEDPSSKECCYIWELLALALNDLVSKGLIEEEAMNSFNIPLYSPSPSEVKSEVLKEGSFTIDHLETSEMNWTTYDSELMMNSPDAFFDGGYNVAKCIRAIVEPLLISHFGDAIIEEVFCKYREILSDCLSKETNNFINVIVSVTKKG
ncbi:salicylate carboxymethyltransferase-like [Juglans regia]|uniref:Salicylate carboxymethyltransferase-like n=1 Tax=Juglans regia TaxID=51240 RepID=A0A6P9F738_JUGRE|nr:salicylate carboxymethyltransferase-like [Juglans regia]